MSFWNHLEKLRERPEQEKKAIALFTALGVTAIIAITWGTMAIATFKKGDVAENSTTVQVSQTASPFTAIKGQINILGTEWGEIKKIFKNEIEIEVDVDIEK